MDMDVVTVMNAPHNPAKERYIHAPVNLTDRLLICGLHTDLQLNKSGTHITD